MSLALSGWLQCVPMARVLLDRSAFVRCSCEVFMYCIHAAVYPCCHVFMSCVNVMCLQSLISNALDLQLDSRRRSLCDFQLRNAFPPWCSIGIVNYKSYSFIPLSLVPHRRKIFTSPSSSSSSKIQKPSNVLPRNSRKNLQIPKPRLLQLPKHNLPPSHNQQLLLRRHRRHRPQRLLHQESP